MRDAAIARIDLRVYTARTLHTRKALLRELATVRSGGVAYSREEYLAGMISMAMPVFNAADQAVAAMGVNTPRVRFTPSHERKVGRILRWASSEMSARLGHRPSLLARATAADRHDTAANRQARTPVAEAGRRMRQTERRSTR